MLIRTEAASHQETEQPGRLLVRGWAADPSRVGSPVEGSLPVPQQGRVRWPERREAPSQRVRQEQPEQPARQAAPTRPGQPVLQQAGPQQAAPGCLA